MFPEEKDWCDVTKLALQILTKIIQVNKQLYLLRIKYYGID